MVFTKTEAAVLEVFTSKIINRFSIREIANLLDKPYPLIHRTIQVLLKERFILNDEKKYLSLNYKENQAALAYIESLRSKKILKKDKIFSLFVKDALQGVKLDFFIFLVFGSYVEKSNARDIDLLFIIEDQNKVNEIEKNLEKIAGNFTREFHIQVISTQSAYEMFAQREKINVLNETLNKHLLLFGAENYYKLLKNAR